MTEYEAVNKSRLKLKGDSGVKKRKKGKDDGKLVEKISKIEKSPDAEEIVTINRREVIPLTKAEKAFQKMKEKKQMNQILDKAKKTHKQRVEEFNRHLDSLTEHYDIPKVSWTK